MRRGQADRVAVPCLPRVSQVLLAACAGDVIGEFPSPPSPAITASPTPELDEGILAEIPVDGSPCFLAEAGGRIWVTAFDGNELARDRSGDERGGLDVPRCPEARAAWSSTTAPSGSRRQNIGTIVRFDPRRGEVVDRIYGSPAGSSASPRPPPGLWGDRAVRASRWCRSIPTRGGSSPGSTSTVRSVVSRSPATSSGVAAEERLVRIDPGAHSVVDTIELESFEPEGSRSAATSSGSRAPSSRASCGSTSAR